MKKFNTIIILLFVLLLPGISNGDGGGVTGELIFHPINLDTQSFSITVTTDEYCWTWDKINQKTVFQEDYYFQMSEITSQVAFDEPKDVNNATLGTIPWGKMNFTVHSTGGHNFSFTIDLRDENWSQNTSIYWTHDTYVNINFQPNGLIFLSQGTAKDVYDHNDPQQLLLNNDVEIWSFWHPNSTPDQYEFKVPVTLHNYVEGSQDNFGYLLAEGLEITSGQPAFFRKNVIRSVEHGTLEHYTNVRNYSYTDNNVNSGNYSYRLKQIDFNGTFAYSEEVNVDVTSPVKFGLGQNYPNPFNPSTKINFSIPQNSEVTLTVFNVLGQEVKTLVQGFMVAGNHTIDFNAAGFNSGIYFYKLQAGSFSEVRKMTLLK